MIRILRTNSKNKDFIKLVTQLDEQLTVIDGGEHDFYSQFNEINEMKYTVVAYIDEIAVACGAIKEYDEDTMEVKRMFTLDKYRGNGIASLVLADLERWAKEMEYSKCILETGKRQPDAIRLYQKNGYLRIDNYGQYSGIENSVCFEKKLN